MDMDNRPNEDLGEELIEAEGLQSAKARKSIKIDSSDNSRKKKKFYITDKQLLVILSVVCVVIIIMSYTSRTVNSPLRVVNDTVFMPMQRGFNDIGLAARDIKLHSYNIKKLEAENQQLKDKINKLETDNSQLQMAKVDYDRLRKLYKIDNELKDYHKVAASVVSKGTGNWFSDFTIDKGSRQGIKKDMNVISESGLVGIVTEVQPNYSRVMAIISDNSNVKAMTLEGNIQCFVSGDLRLMNQGYIRILGAKDSDGKIKIGDKIVTSNISTKYLPNILIGYVRNIKTDPNQILKSGYLSPATDFSKLNKVLVITDLKQ